MKKLVLFALLATPVCAARAWDSSATKFEAVPQGEAQEITEMVDLTHKLLEQRYGGSAGETMARRAVHPKAHGCVKADFTVNQDLPEKYRVGLFATPGKSYKAWVRFSNATAIVRPDVNDNRADSRGMAVKVMGVEGDTLMNEPGGKTQDFLLINQPMFAFPNVHEYLEFTRIQFANKEDVRPFFAPQTLTDARKKIGGIVQKIATMHIANPLDAPYFSASAFLLGPENAAKFAARPRGAPANPSLPDRTPTDYLREAMKKSLSIAEGSPVVFDFQIQLRPDGLSPTDADYPIESANDEWKPKGDGTAAYQNVATITIRPQDFDTPLQNTECEHLVFTPWHGLTAHQPLGGINRLRREVYIASSRHRADHREPTDYPKWPF
ncbi:hypothetical protein AMST5_00249 [freshwater sediment metagenome]|uniref:Catalase core domain-containing protein n=1 Tax=freshwater sediment metagenome TaxID=556182 RepID=A0AA48M010_9ZZZZ